MMLRAAGLGFDYGGAPVLDDVSLDVAAGELVGIVGPNGAGKSTLLACLHGALRPRRGTVLLDGVDVRTLSPKSVARSIGVVPQRCEVPFPVSVETFVGLGRYAHESWFHGSNAADREIVRGVLARMQLEPLARRSVAELSGGEFRRALVAQALAQEPRLLLFDEPVQQLDLLHRVEVMEFARAFTRSERTAGVIVLHELDLAARWCDRLVLMHRGRVVAAGVPGDVLTAPLLRQVFGVDVAIERSSATGALHVVPLVAQTDAPPRSL